MSGKDVSWIHQWPAAGRPTFRLGRAGDDLVAEWVGFGILRAHASGTPSEFRAAGNAPPHVRERLSQAIEALLRHLHGGVTLHASSCARGRVAIACLGESGAGKSTLAAKLCATGQVALLCDDTTALAFDRPQVEVEPTEGHHWLRPDMAEAMGIDHSGCLKVPVAAVQQGRERVALRAIVNLVTDPEATAPTLNRIRGSSAFLALSASTFRFALDLPEVLQRELDNLARTAQDVDVYELRRSRAPASLDAGCAAVERLLDVLEEPDRDYT